MLVVKKALVPFLVLGEKLRRNVRNNIWRMGPSTPSKKETAPATTTTEKEAKSVNDIQQEVRELLENHLVGKADAVKLTTLLTLVAHLDAGTKTRTPENDEYRRAIAEWDGCHLVLIVLRQELDKGEQHASWLVVHSSIRFLLLWNYYGDLEDTLMGLDGVRAVARAMQAFPNEFHINYGAVLCIYNLTCGTGGAARFQKLVDEDCIPVIHRALPTLKSSPHAKKHAVLALERLSRVATPQQMDGLVDASVMEALVDVYNAHVDSEENVAAACRSLLNKLML